MADGDQNNSGSAQDGATNGATNDTAKTADQSGATGDQQTPEQKAAADKTAQDQATQAGTKTAEEQKAIDDKAAADKLAADKAAQPVVPEKYEVALPEGVAAEETVMTEFTAICKELKLTNEQAQKLASLGGNMMKNFGAKAEAKNGTLISEAQAHWIERTKADKEIGGTPEQLAANLAIAKRGMDAYAASPELKGLLAATKLGDHPEFIRMFVAIGKTVSEDTVVGRNNNTENTGDKTPGQILFSETMTPKK